MTKSLKCKEMVQKFNDSYGKNVIITCEFDFGSLDIANTDHLFVYEDGDKIVMQDDNDLSLIINKSFISSSTLSDFDAYYEKIDLDLGTDKLSFIM